MIFAVSSAFFCTHRRLVREPLWLDPCGARLVHFWIYRFERQSHYLIDIYSHETVRGVQRMQETSSARSLNHRASIVPFSSEAPHSKPILAALSLMIITNIYTTVSGSFWGVLFTTKLGFADLISRSMSPYDLL